MGHRGPKSNSHTMFDRKDCLVLLSALKAVYSISESNTEKCTATCLDINKCKKCRVVNVLTSNCAFFIFAVLVI